MSLAWNPLGSFGLAVFVVASVLAFVVFRTAPSRPMNRLLALCLLLEGLWYGGIGMFFLLTEAADVFAMAVVVLIAMSALPWVYLAFLSQSLSTPLVAPFRSRGARRFLVLAAAVSAALVILGTDWFLRGTRSDVGSVWLPVWGPGDSVGAVVIASVFLFGIIAAIDAFRRAPRTSIERRRSLAFIVAFGLRDVFMAFLFIGLGSLFYFRAGGSIQYDSGLVFTMWIIVRPIVLLVYLLLLAYAILRHQLLGLDLHIKWTIHRGTLIGIFIGCFFVSAQVAQAFLVTEWGWAVGGIVAGLLLLAINPLQRFAGRVADVAMPRVADTEDYRDRRTEEVYRAALEEMLADGTVSLKERRVLLRLQERLGLDPGHANRLESEVMRSVEGSK